MEDEIIYHSIVHLISLLLLHIGSYRRKISNWSMRVQRIHVCSGSLDSILSPFNDDRASPRIAFNSYPHDARHRTLRRVRQVFRLSTSF